MPSDLPRFPGPVVRSLVLGLAAALPFAPGAWAVQRRSPGAPRSIASRPSAARMPAGPAAARGAAVMVGSPLRLPQLDALRGLAALVVVAHHGLLALPEGHPLREWCQGHPALAAVTLGRPAVILFFTLSGFVLALSLSSSLSSSLAEAGGLRSRARSRARSCARYCARRATRLLLPFWAALCFATLLCACVPRRHAADFSSWFNGQWEAVSPWEFFSDLPLLVGPGHFSFDQAMWSLTHELRLSLALPLILFTARRLGTPACLAIAAAGAAAAEAAIARHPAAFPIGYNGYLFDAPELLPSLAVTLRFLPAFALGAVLAIHVGRVARWAAAWPAATLALGLVGLVALSHRLEHVMMAGSVAVVAVASTSPLAARVLDNGPLRWLGRVSFSLYLVHLPILLTLGLALDGSAPASATVVLAVILSLVFADVFHQLVEGPAIALSRDLASDRPADGPTPELWRPATPPGGMVAIRGDVVSR